MIHFFADSNGHNLALPEHRQSHHLALPPLQWYPVWLYYQSTYHEIITLSRHLELAHASRIKEQGQRIHEKAGLTDHTDLQSPVASQTYTDVCTFTGNQTHILSFSIERSKCALGQHYLSKPTHYGSLCWGTRGRVVVHHEDRQLSVLL